MTASRLQLDTAVLLLRFDLTVRLIYQINSFVLRCGQCRWQQRCMWRARVSETPFSDITQLLQQLTLHPQPSITITVIYTPRSASSSTPQ